MIIKSIIDTDLYKITMMYAVFKHYRNTIVRYKFTDRSGTVYPDGFDVLLKQEVKHMESLFLTKDEKKFLSKKCGDFLPQSFIDFLEDYRFNSNELDISLDKDNHLVITIEGSWVSCIMWEVTLMAVISELYFKSTGQIVDIDTDELNQLDIDKYKLFEKNGVSFTDMGTRRRYSYENQLRVVRNLSQFGNKTFNGTSNLHFAQMFDIKPYGSIAHEFIMVNAVLNGYKKANTSSMDVWNSTYDKYLDTFLPDTYPIGIFLNDFDLVHANMFSCIRHDSGCPFEFVDIMVEHYIKLGICPMSKTIIFSDGLDPETVVKIKLYCEGKINCTFGIGTNLTNNIPGITPLKIVIKIYQVLVDGVWIDAVKLSNDKGKYTGNENEVQKCLKTLGII